MKGRRRDVAQTAAAAPRLICPRRRGGEAFIIFLVFRCRGRLMSRPVIVRDQSPPAAVPPGFQAAFGPGTDEGPSPRAGLLRKIQSADSDRLIHEGSGSPGHFSAAPTARRHSAKTFRSDTPASSTRDSRDTQADLAPRLMHLICAAKQRERCSYFQKYFYEHLAPGSLAHDARVLA